MSFQAGFQMSPLGAKIEKMCEKLAPKCEKMTKSGNKISKKIIFDIIFGRLFTLLQRISFSEPVREPTEPL